MAEAGQEQGNKGEAAESSAQYGHFTAMNCGCAVFLLMSVVVGGIIGWGLGREYGLIGMAIGAVAGGLAGVVFVYAIWGALWLIGRFWYLWRPLRPVCRSGCCREGDYELVEVSGTRTVWLCGCGTKYVRSGRLFSELLPDGTTRPYMRRGGIRGWKLDTRGIGG